MSSQCPQQSFDDFAELGAKLKEEVRSLPHGAKREALLQRARKLEAALDIFKSWASSPGLRAPR